MSGCPGTERSALTMTRPARSHSAPSHSAAGDAFTPAAHTMVRASIRSPPSETPPQSHSVTPAPRRTSTPSCSSERRAASDNEGSNGASRRGPASTRMMRVERGSMERKSIASARLASSAMAPAISTPVGPPPTTTKFNSRRRSSGSVSVSARSNASRMRRRKIGGVVDGLQARRIGCPVVAEIGVLGAGGDHQVVERNPTALGDDLLVDGIDTRNLGQDHGDVLRVAQNSADRRRDVGRRQAGGGHLIQAAAGTGGNCADRPR